VEPAVVGGALLGPPAEGECDGIEEGLWASRGQSAPKEAYKEVYIPMRAVFVRVIGCRGSGVGVLEKYQASHALCKIGWEW